MVSTHQKVIFTIGFPLVDESLDEIRLAIKSIYAQSLVDWELFVFCDGSPQSHIELIQSIDDERVRVLVNERSTGIARSLNRLAKMANGEYIAILAADDLWTTDRLKLQYDRMKGEDRPDVLAAQMLVISDSATVEGAQRKAVLPSEPQGWVSGTPISHATAIASPEWFLRHPYDETLVRAQDRAFWIQAHQGSSIEILDDYVYFYRVPKPISYKKYAWSSKYARRVILKYGPLLCSRTAVARIYLTSLVKQWITKIAVSIKGTDRLYERRIEKIPASQITHYSDQLIHISRTTVPGWN